MFVDKLALQHKYFLATPVLVGHELFSRRPAHQSGVLRAKFVQRHHHESPLAWPPRFS